jgi:hypothetical protein
VFEHYLGPVAMPTDEQVDVIRHQRAGVTGVPGLSDDPGEASGNHSAVGLVELQKLMLQRFARLPIELAQNGR